MLTTPLTIARMLPTDWPAVAAIYRDGIATGQATFETAVPNWDEFDAQHCVAARLVARLNTRIVGWAALSPVSARAAYRGVVEVSVYVAAGHRRRGIGRALLAELIRKSEAAGFWMLQAVICSDNAASLALHAACGFRQVGRRERIGQLCGVWRDTVLLERRSAIVGV
ncbi:MAG: N-acetyltransferase [Chloroflexi bacterium]|nr:N-acetyltransferase [Chloroflexota bacterium]